MGRGEGKITLTTQRQKLRIQNLRREKEKIMDNPISNRIKSFLWRFGAYLISIGLVWLIDNIASLQLSPFLTTLIGLGLGEISKYWNNKMKFAGKTFLGFSKNS